MLTRREALGAIVVPAALVGSRRRPSEADVMATAREMFKVGMQAAKKADMDDRGYTWIEWEDSPAPHTVGWIVFAKWHLERCV